MQRLSLAKLANLMVIDTVLKILTIVININNNEVFTNQIVIKYIYKIDTKLKQMKH